MTKVVLHRLFIANFKDILDYIELDNSKKVADRIEKSIMDAIELLQYVPSYGQLVVDIHGKEVLHIIVVGYYRIIYSIIKDVVYVEDIFDSRSYHRLPIN